MSGHETRTAIARQSRRARKIEIVDLKRAQRNFLLRFPIVHLQFESLDLILKTVDRLDDLLILLSNILLCPLDLARLHASRSLPLRPHTNQLPIL